MNTIFNNIDIDLYFLEFLNIKQILKILVISKSSFKLVTQSKYYDELKSYRSLYTKINIIDVCKHGFLNLLKLCIREIYLDVPYYLLQDGQNFIVRYSKTTNYMVNNNINLTFNESMKKAFEYGQLNIVKYLFYLGFEILNNRIILSFCISKEYILQNIKYLTFLGNTLNTIVLKNCIKYGCLNVIKYLIYINGEYYIYVNDYIKIAATCGKLNITKYFIKLTTNIYLDNDKSIQIAAENGYLEVVKYLLILGANIKSNNNYSVTWSAINGYIEVTKFLYYHGANINANINFVTEWLLINNQLEIINFMISNGIILNLNCN